MIIKNISKVESGVANLKNELVMVQPGESVEVNDVKGRYLTSSYNHIFKQVNTLEKIEKVVTTEEPVIDVTETVGEESIEDLGELDLELTESLVVTTEEPIVTTELTIESARLAYSEKFGTQVPPNKKNDIEWLKSKINS